jgi:predicted DNA binding CopG/RHH family protein
VPFTIYGLVDPRTGQARYVGCTAQPLEVRVRQHLADQASNPRKQQWLEELRQLNLEPEVVVLEEADDEPAERERHWITVKLTEGCQLLNGWGPRYWTHSLSQPIQLGEPVRGPATEAESAMMDVLEAQADTDIDQRLRDERDGKERRWLRWGREQLNVVREAARLAGVPYETYIKLVVYRQALADVHAAHVIGQRAAQP